MSALEDLFLFQLRAAGLPEPVREFKFAHALTGRSWRADFAWPALYPPLLVEIEGGVWKGAEGGHTSGTGYTRDMEKYNTAGELGFRVLRFSGGQVRSGAALDRVERNLKGAYPVPDQRPDQAAALC